MKYEASPGGTSAKVSASTILFNGYLDLGTWYRATPYIGAGAGTARVSISDYSSAAMPPFSGDGSRSKWNFAWAAMAGVAYAISSNMMVDVGYRYLNIGDATTGSDAFGSTTLKNIAAHEVRVGLRWSFDDFPVTR
jgi:opacity protein-like surface antigen